MIVCLCTTITQQAGDQQQGDDKGKSDNNNTPKCRKNEVGCPAIYDM